MTCLSITKIPKNDKECACILTGFLKRKGLEWTDITTVQYTGFNVIIIHIIIVIIIIIHISVHKDIFLKSIVEEGTLKPPYYNQAILKKSYINILVVSRLLVSYSTLQKRHVIKHVSPAVEPKLDVLYLHFFLTEFDFHFRVMQGCQPNPAL